MKLALVLAWTAMAAEPAGKFKDGFEGKNRDVSIRISAVHDGPACRARGNCKWMILWESKRRAEQVEIAITLAGMDAPAIAAVVPGKKLAPRDQRNPIFDVPLASVRVIDFTLRNGTKEVGSARFQ